MTLSGTARHVFKYDDAFPQRALVLYVLNSRIMLSSAKHSPNAVWRILRQGRGRRMSCVRCLLGELSSVLLAPILAIISSGRVQSFTFSTGEGRLIPRDHGLVSRKERGSTCDKNGHDKVINSIIEEIRNEMKCRCSKPWNAPRRGVVQYLQYSFSRHPPYREPFSP